MVNLLSLYSIFLPLLIGCINFNQLEANAKVLLLIVAFASIAHIFTIYDPQTLPIFFYNSYILIDAVLWPILYAITSSNVMIRKAILVIMAISIIIISAYIFSQGIMTRFFYEMVCLNSILQVVYIAFYFFELNTKDELINLQKTPTFWFSLGLLFYAPCTFFIFLFYNKINSYYSKSHINYLWQIHSLFNFLMYMLFAIGLRIKKVKKIVKD